MTETDVKPSGLIRILPHLQTRRQETEQLLAGTDPRLLVATRHASESVLDQLALHSDLDIRVGVALNPNTSRTTRISLSKDKSRTVAQAATRPKDWRPSKRAGGVATTLAFAGSLINSYNAREELEAAASLLGIQAIDQAVLDSISSGELLSFYVSSIRKPRSSAVSDIGEPVQALHLTLMTIRHRQAVKRIMGFKRAREQFPEFLAALAQSPEELEPFIGSDIEKVRLTAWANPYGASEQKETIEHEYPQSWRDETTHATEADSWIELLEGFSNGSGKLDEVLVARDDQTVSPNLPPETDTPGSDITQIAALRGVSRTALGGVPWPWVRYPESLTNHLGSEEALLQLHRVRNYAAQAIDHAPETIDLEVIHTLDLEFEGSIDEMLAVARL